MKITVSLSLVCFLALLSLSLPMTGQGISVVTAPGVAIQLAGSPQGQATTLNFSTNTSVSLTGGVATVTATGGGSGSFVLVEEHTASNSAALNFTSCISATYDDYQIRVVNLLPATNSIRIILQCSTNGGSSYDTGSNYQWGAHFDLANLGTGVEGSNVTDTGMQYSPGEIDNANPWSGMNGFINMYNPGGSFNKMFDGHVSSKDSRDNAMGSRITSSAYISSTAVNAFRFIASTGNLTSGTVRCYGLTH